MDGTLVDSEPLHTLAWTRLVSSLGHPVSDPAWLDAFIGVPDFETSLAILAMFPDLARAGDVLEMKQDIYRELVARQGGGLAMPGIFTPLRQLSAAGIPMAVVTNGVLRNSRFVLSASGLLPFFRTLATVDQVERGKPAPDLYCEAARRLGAEPARCVVVEDSSAGAESGAAAGAFVVGVSWAQTPRDLRAADIVLPGTAAAIEWIIDQLA